MTWEYGTQRSQLERRPKWRIEFLERVLIPTKLAGVNAAASTYESDKEAVDAHLAELRLLTGDSEDSWDARVGRIILQADRALAQWRAIQQQGE